MPDDVNDCNKGGGSTEDGAKGVGATKEDGLKEEVPKARDTEEYMKLRAENPPCEEEKELLRRRATAKMVFTKKFNLFQERHRRKDPHEALKLAFTELENRFMILEKSCLELVDFYTLRSFNEIFIDEALDYSGSCEQLKLDMYLLLLESKSSESINLESKGASGDGDTVVKNSTKLKLEATKLPRFGGKVRDYPSFLDDFKRVVQPVCGKNPTILKQCLDDDALELVRHRDSDFDIMMSLLQVEYGDPRKVVKAVVKDMRKLSKVADDDTKGFVEMIRVIQACHSDLKKVGMETEISNLNFVNDLEELLPKEPRQRWMRLSRDITAKDELFPKLLDFLLEEKRDLERWLASEKQGKKCVTFNATKVDQSDDPSTKLVEFMSATNSSLEKLCNKIAEMESKPFNRNKGGGWCSYHNYQGHVTANCPKFRGLSVSERAEFLRRKNICFCCLSTGHPASSCPKQMGCAMRVEGILCNQRHHALVHDFFVRPVSGVVGSNFFSSASKVLLETSLAYSNGVPITILWDGGAQGSLITHRKARELGLVGVHVSGPMSGVGDSQQWVQTKKYIVSIQDLWGNTHNIICAGMDEVAGKVSFFDVKKVAHIFPEFDVANMIRPSGYCDLLIGNNYCSLHPKPVAEVGNLQLMQSLFGFSIRGEPSEDIVSQPSHVAAFNNASCDLQPDCVKDNLDKLFQVEASGIQAPVKVEDPVEKFELELIERGLRFDDEQRIWVAAYPWIKDPELLPNNYRAVLGRLKSLEKKLLGDVSQGQAYQREVEDMLARGVARTVDRDELRGYRGPVHYIAHFAVHRPEHLTTPLRIVFDPTTQFMGHKLNEFWAKGPNFVSNLFVVLLRFRRDVVGIVGDVSKMYHSVHLEYNEQHVHRFLWRDLEVSKEPQVYALTRVTFGDRPSGILATMAMQYTALMHKELYPDVVDVVHRDTYVDDMLPNAGSRSEAQRLTQRVDMVLAEGNFKVKGWVISGEAHSQAVDVDMNKELGQKVLGMRWTPGTDEFSFILKLNFNPKHRGVRRGCDLTRESCLSEFPLNLTRRMLVSQLASIFDPYGYLLPFTIGAKLKLRSLISSRPGMDWDEPLREENVSEWKLYFLELFDIEALSFPRSLKPVNAVGNPTLIVFSDASESAYGSCAYIRWECADGEVLTRLIAAKSRVAPMQQQPVPRLEMAWAVLGVRLRQVIVTEIGIKFSEVVHIVDSSIVLAQIQGDSTRFKMFVAVRVGEIQEKSAVSDWCWVESKLNVADMLTKPCSAQELGKGSTWQEGPSFLRSERAQWPVHQNIGNRKMEEVPDVKINTSSELVGDGTCIWDLINEGNFSSFSKLTKVIALLIGISRRKSFKGVAGLSFSLEWIECAEKKLIVEAQAHLGNWEKQFAKLGPFKNDGVVYVGGRLKHWLKDNWNAEAYVLLPSNHAISFLIVT